MSAEDYTRSLTDEELQREIDRRNREKEKVRHLELIEAARLESDAKEASDREFAERAGITWEQYQQVAAYVSDKIYDNL